MPEKLYSIKESAMTNMADTIRQLTGTTGPITGEEIGNYIATNLPNSENLDEVLEDQDDIIAQIQTALQGKAAGGSAEPVLQEKTVDPSTSSQTVTADSEYDGLSQVTVNAMPTATQATPSITVDASGLITATATQTSGYVVGGTKSATKQLAFQAAKTITPTTTNQTAVSSGYYTGGAITVKGDSNLVAGNIKSGVSIFGVNGTYAGSGGDTSIEDALFTGTMVNNYTNDRITQLATYALAYRGELLEVSFPKVSIIYSYALYSTGISQVNIPSATYIGSYAFAYCRSLKSVDFPKVSRIELGAFSYCNQLAGAYFSEASFIGTGAFNNCTNLSEVFCPAVTIINEQAFYYCSKLSSVDFPSVSRIGEYAFYGNSNLSTINFPIASYIANSAFRSCTSLAAINLPKLSSTGTGVFVNCSNLTTAQLPQINRIGNQAFMGCYNLSTLVVGTDLSTVCTLSNSNAFMNTPYAGYSASYSGTPVIYVPASLVSQYKTATNWTYFSSMITAYES